MLQREVSSLHIGQFTLDNTTQSALCIGDKNENRNKKNQPIVRKIKLFKRKPQLIPVNKTLRGELLNRVARLGTHVQRPHGHFVDPRQ